MKIREMSRARRAAKVVFGDNPCHFLADPRVRITQCTEKDDLVVLITFTLEDEPDIQFFLKVCVAASSGGTEGGDALVEEALFRRGGAAEEAILKQVSGVRKLAPYAIQYLASFHCKDLKELVHDGMPDVVRTEFSKLLLENILEPLPVVFLFMEHSSGMDLFRFFRMAETFGYFDLLAVLGQLVYMLHLMEVHEIYHNDLHVGNILVETIDKPVARVLKWEGGTVTLPPSRFIPRVIDWGMGQSKEHPENPNNIDLSDGDPCKKMGICMKPNRDLAQLMYNIKFQCNEAEYGRRLTTPIKHLRELLFDIVGNDEWMKSYTSQHVSDGHPCYSTKDDCILVESNSATQGLEVFAKYIRGLHP